MNRGPAHHQRFLVGEQDALAGAHRGECGRESRRADDRRQYGVDLGQRRNFRQAVGAGEHAGRHTIARELPLQLQGRRGVGQRGVSRTKAPAQFGELDDVRMRGERGHREALGCRATTSSVESPIDPVAPSSVNLLIGVPSRLAFMPS
jgi:hypothetical protein